MLLYRNTYYGQPSNVDTVKRVSKALLTSSKLRGLLIHSLFSTDGLLMSSPIYSIYCPLQIEINKITKP